MLAAAGACSAAGVIGPTGAATIIARSVAANQRDWQAAPHFTYFERDRTPSGTVTYRVSMILGSPYRQLVESNGRPLSAADQAAEQRKLEEAVQQRQGESPAQRAERLTGYKEDRRRDHLMLQQLTVAFNFKLLGRQMLGQRDVWVLQATPRSGYTPPNRDSRVLTGMRGKLWIDTQTYQWVKVEARVVQPVWIEGFFARVQPGTRFELDYAPVTTNIWLPTHFLMRSRAKVLFLFTRRDQDDESYFGYQRSPGLPSPIAPAGLR